MGSKHLKDKARGGDFPRGGFPRHLEKRRVPPATSPAAASPTDPASGETETPDEQKRYHRR